MAAPAKGARVAVTGAAGFVGGWVVRLLLDKGYRVRACVRDVDDDTRAGFLKVLPGHASGRLTLHAADLDREGCYDAIFRGCDGVCHVAHVSDYDDAAYVQRVCDHIIASIEKSGSVRRVVVTSSIAAVISEMDLQELVRRPILDEDRYPDETNPKRTVERGQGYSMGKIIAQRVFTEAAARSGKWDAITCCPGDNVGPIQSAHQKDMGPWQHNIERMLLGRVGQADHAGHIGAEAGGHARRRGVGEERLSVGGEVGVDLRRERRRHLERRPDGPHQERRRAAHHVQARLPQETPHRRPDRRSRGEAPAEAPWGEPLVIHGARRVVERGQLRVHFRGI